MTLPNQKEMFLEQQNKQKKFTKLGLHQSQFYENITEHLSEEFW